MTKTGDEAGGENKEAVAGDTVRAKVATRGKASQFLGVGGRAGSAGERCELASCLAAQQAALAHFRQQHAALAGQEAAPSDAVKTPGHVKTKQNRIAKRFFTASVNQMGRLAGSRPGVR